MDNKEYQREWQKRNPEKVRGYRQNARIRKAIEEIRQKAPARVVFIQQNEIDLMKRYLDWWDNAGWHVAGGRSVICEESIDMNLLRQMKPMLIDIIERAKKGGISLHD